MQEIDEATFKKAKEIAPEKKEKVVEKIDPEKIEGMLAKMNNPVNAQKEMAVKIKVFLDKVMEEEMSEKGYLTDHTRKWVESYNSILEKIQKALHGDKSVNLHLHKISHSEVAHKIREAQKKVFVVSEPKKEKKTE